MSFLDGEPNLTGTRYSSSDLTRAREVLLSAVAKVDPGWLDSPVGPLALYWRNGSGQYAATYLIHLAQVLYVLDRNVTTKSVPVLLEKVRELLRPPARDDAFEELLSELELAAVLASRVSPIAFEPLVPPSAHKSPKTKPRSPDYAVRLPDGDVCFEVTNIHFGFLDKWDVAAAYTADRLSRFILRRNLRRAIRFEAPSSSSRADLDELVVPSVLTEIQRNETGRRAIDLEGVGVATLGWGPVPHFPVGPDGFPLFDEGTDFPIAAATFGQTAGPTASVEYAPVVDGQAIEDVVLRSIRNSLKTKRSQLTVSLPYVLVVRIAHHRINQQAVSRLIVERLFPNDDYKWLTGIALFTPARNWELASVEPSLLLHLNDNATHIASQALIDVFSGTRQFHL